MVGAVLVVAGVAIACYMFKDNIFGPKTEQKTVDPAKDQKVEALKEDVAAAQKAVEQAAENKAAAAATLAAKPDDAQAQKDMETAEKEAAVAAHNLEVAQKALNDALTDYKQGMVTNAVKNVGDLNKYKNVKGEEMTEADVKAIGTINPLSWMYGLKSSYLKNSLKIGEAVNSKEFRKTNREQILEISNSVTETVQPAMKLFVNLLDREQLKTALKSKTFDKDLVDLLENTRTIKEFIMCEEEAPEPTKGEKPIQVEKKEIDVEKITDESLARLKTIATVANTLGEQKAVFESFQTKTGYFGLRREFVKVQETVGFKKLRELQKDADAALKIVFALAGYTTMSRYGYYKYMSPIASSSELKDKDGNAQEPPAGKKVLNRDDASLMAASEMFQKITGDDKKKFEAYTCNNVQAYNFFPDFLKAEVGDGKQKIQTNHGEKVVMDIFAVKEPRNSVWVFIHTAMKAADQVQGLIAFKEFRDAFKKELASKQSENKANQNEEK